MPLQASSEIRRRKSLRYKRIKFTEFNPRHKLRKKQKDKEYHILKC